MIRLTRHIEEALYTHECVVLPAFGAFIRHDMPSKLDETKGLIYPGHSELSFNAEINTNDGILVGRYREAYALNYKRALALLETDINQLREGMAKGQPVTIGAIGKLLMNQQNQTITFIPNSNHPFSTAFFGLTPIAPLPRRQQEINATDSTTPKKDGVIYLPIPVRGLKYGAAAIALIAITLMTPIGAIDSSAPNSYHAGFLTALTEQKASPAPTSTTPQQNTEASTPLETQSEQDVEVADSPATPKSLHGLRWIETPTGHTTYYLIIASLQGEDQVEEYMKYADLKDFPNVGVVSSGSRYRVFADKFETMEEAQAYLNRLTKEETYASAWIFKGK